MKLWPLGLLAIAPLLGAFAPAPISPAGQWVVNWADFKCLLVRQSGGPEPVSLFLQWEPGIRELDLKWLSGNGLSPSRSRVRELFIDPGHVRVEALAVADFGHGLSVGSMKVDDVFLDRLASAASIRLEENGSVLRELPLPEAARAVAAFRECRDDALRGWGIDPVAYTALRRLPKAMGGSTQWVRYSDYPPAALHQNRSGRPVARLTVGPDGRVSDCKIVHASGTPDLDTKTCDVMKRRARYEPALGPDGAPVAAPVIVGVNWRVLR